ncbi:methyltransferase domain-containing protein [Stutzerimonas stutzeri]|uniref:methyltransferase domain-containing protein n=1 Tax=Stutzerimonas stutzeri TaxID=316 RepID=UPI002449A5B1|nr:methyltransferase domain-containing protein [Stutzerimonas stutzeri]MDH0156407.1 methyltransferase domain-containing protein [Stutzerimonas stutzeri]
MLIPNNPDIDFEELNRRLTEDVARYHSEGQTRTLPFFDPAPPANALELPMSWERLVTLEDDALIRAAYQFLLGRPADPAGAAHWGSQLRQGIDKFEVLANLRYSAEGKRHAAPTYGLRRARLKGMVRRIPLIGSALFTLYGIARTEARHQNYTARLRQLETQQRAQSQSHEALHRQMQHERQLLSERSKSLESDLQQLSDQIRKQHQQFTSWQQDMDRRAQEARMRINQLETVDSTARTTAATSEKKSALPTPSFIPDSFYLAFENRFRGDAETIRSRLAYYLPLLEDCKPLHDGLPAVDIGCGRGEWLKMLPITSQRIGVDLNATNIQTCMEQGLDAVQDDALNWLTRQPKDSLALVSAFHVIEHLSFEQLNMLLDQCQRVLAPGGMIIFETPNPENLISAATHFYTDPTHVHPLPPAFTEFMVQYKGFQETRIHRLNPIPREYALNEDSEVARRCDVLFYGPQDYAVTAIKGQV